MKQSAYIAGVGMMPFGKHQNTTLKALNPMAQFRDVLTVDDVLNAREITCPPTFEADSAALASSQAYQDADLGPENIDVVELHDAAAMVVSILGGGRA